MTIMLPNKSRNNLLALRYYKKIVFPNVIIGWDPQILVPFLYRYPFESNSDFSLNQFVSTERPIQKFRHSFRIYSSIPTNPSEFTAWVRPCNHYMICEES